MMKELIAELKKLGVKATPTMGEDGTKGIMFYNGEENIFYSAHPGNISVAIKEISLLLTEERRKQFDQWLSVKEKLTYSLKRERKGSELAKSFLDVWIIPQFILQETSKGRMSTFILPENLKEWNIDEDTIFEVAYENEFKKQTYITMREVLTQLCGMSAGLILGDQEHDMPMYVCSNEQSVSGAGAMLNRNILQEIMEKTDSEKLYIFPSSVHECIVVPFQEGIDPSMVKDINNSTVAENEILSDNIYIYEKGEYYILH